MIKKIVLSAIAVLYMSTASADKNEDQKNQYQAFNGIWVLNVELSDDTDRQVEHAIKAAGGKITHARKRRTGKTGKYKYKGGPKNHALYDHVSYDEAFTFYSEYPRVWLGYLNNYTREFYADGRGRSASAADGELKDYSFASWHNNMLYVEARPRDGGFTQEVYSLINKGAQLKVMLTLKPLNFSAPIKIMRIFDRQTPD